MIYNPPCLMKPKSKAEKVEFYIEQFVTGTGTMTTKTTAYCEEGMTWADWCDSAYNTWEYVAIIDMVCRTQKALGTNTVTRTIYIGATRVASTDVIVEGATYSERKSGSV